MLEIDAFRLENGGKFLERDDEIHVAAHRAAGSLQLFRRARSHEYHARRGVFFLDGARRRHHGRQGIGNFVHRFGEITLCQHRPGRTARGEHKGLLSARHFLHVMVRLGDRAHIRAECHFEYVPEPEFQKRGFDPPGRRLFSELSHVCRRDLHHDLVATFQSAYQLKDLRFIRDRAKGTTDHAHAAGYALVVIDLGAAQIVALDGFHAARFRARARVVGDGVVRADGLAPPPWGTLPYRDAPRNRGSYP